MNTQPERLVIASLIEEAVLGGARLAPACALLGFSARTLQRWEAANDGPDGRTLRHEPPAHKFSPTERATLLAVANSAEFGHLPPSQIVPRLADQNRYIGSESTLYRVLRDEGQLAHRRVERRGQKRSKPRALSATEPNQLYTWDISYLPSTVHGQYFYLYLYLDVFSRKIVAWQIYAEENGANASEVMRDLCRREGIMPGQLVLHSDNGGSMKGSTMVATLRSLGVMASLSRPAVSNDNPFSESLFKTMKYRPAYPRRPFENLMAARQWVGTFVHWYNEEHRHSAINFVTPAQRHAGLDGAMLRKRNDVYAEAKARNPERWSGATRNWKHVTTVHLNPDKPDLEGANRKEKFPELKKAA